MLGDMLFCLGLILTIVIFVLYYLADFVLKRIDAKTGLTGEEIARNMLNKYGLSNIEILEGKEDCYSSDKKRVYLSKKVYHGKSIASLAIACHECGHAIQHDKGYHPLQVQIKFDLIHALIEKVTLLLCLYGYFISDTYFTIYVFLYFTNSFLFEMYSIPCEMNASKYAIQYLSQVLSKKRHLNYSDYFLRLAQSTYWVNELIPLFWFIELFIF